MDNWYWVFEGPSKVAIMRGSRGTMSRSQAERELSAAMDRWLRKQIKQISYLNTRIGAGVFSTGVE